MTGYPKQNYATAAREVWDCLDTALLLRGAFRETTSIPEIEAVIRKACDLIEDPNDPEEGAGEAIIESVSSPMTNAGPGLRIEFEDGSVLTADPENGLHDIADVERAEAEAEAEAEEDE